ncbi:DUF6193 family natural product biosynthesis protein [Streptomyces microflavus]|uniref:DUF6193 family natural product biosynthesis protein n=1 Tax=Streptomyces microflavus TaxID=1919 RepID=UPI00332F9918
MGPGHRVGYRGHAGPGGCGQSWCGLRARQKPARAGPVALLHTSERAEAHDRGSAAVVGLQWRKMQEQADEAPEFPGFGLLVEAAHADPRLRQLHVYSSHWTLGFSSCTGFPFRNEAAIAPAHNGRPYRVMKHPHSNAIGETATADMVELRTVFAGEYSVLTRWGPARGKR